jgi:SAM-dependent methyltransferase
MPENWTSETVLDAARSYQVACVLTAASELDLFSALSEGAVSPAELALRVRGDTRGTAILADALTALGLVRKREGAYSLAPGVASALSEGSPENVLPMLRHQANCMRSWARLAEVVRRGGQVDVGESVRGAGADQAAFIEAMRVASRDAAPKVVAALGPPPFTHLLDVGGGPGTWTIAFLRAAREARATLYDLPEVIPIAKKHVESAGLGGRVDFVPGSFATDPVLPGGCDLAWVSAIAHQNSRRENRELFAKVHDALVPGGTILIRDIVMDETHASPAAGAMFAVNMLVRTEGGGTWSLAEFEEDLRAAGFGPAALVHGMRDMDSVVRASRA